MYKLEVQDLHKRYGSHEVLKGVSLAAKAGDVISIIGSSGSGKSTFLRCINLLEQPHAGKILLNGEELKLVPGRDGALKAADSRQLQRMRSRLSMVFQHFNLWSHMSALENVIEAPVHVLGVSKKEAIARQAGTPGLLELQDRLRPGRHGHPDAELRDPYPDRPVGDRHRRSRLHPHHDPARLRRRRLDRRDPLRPHRPGADPATDGALVRLLHLPLRLAQNYEQLLVART